MKNELTYWGYLRSLGKSRRDRARAKIAASLLLFMAFLVGIVALSLFGKR